MGKMTVFASSCRSRSLVGKQALCCRGVWDTECACACRMSDSVLLCRVCTCTGTRAVGHMLCRVPMCVRPRAVACALSVRTTRCICVARVLLGVPAGSHGAHGLSEGNGRRSLRPASHSLCRAFTHRCCRRDSGDGRPLPAGPRTGPGHSQLAQSPLLRPRAISEQTPGAGDVASALEQPAA